MQDSGCGLPRRPQVVEKVVVGPIGSLEQPQNTSKPAQNTTKPGFKALERGSETSTRGFFNTLVCSRKFGRSLSALRHLVSWRTYTPLRQEYAATVTWHS